MEIGIYMDRILVNKTYNNSLRNQDVCGGAAADSIDQIHAYMSH